MAGLINSATRSNYNPAQISAANWAVKPNQTVQGQVKSIIAEDSPLMQQAATRANQQVNARGLINSSIGVGAGQAALYDAAMPMATQDASIEANASKFNAEASQQTAMANQNASNSALQFNAAANQDGSHFAQTNALDRYKTDQATTMERARLDQSGSQFAQTNALDRYKTDQTAGLERERLSQTVGMDRYKADQTAALERERLKQTTDLDRYRFDVSQSNEFAKMGIENTTRMELANIEAGYKTLMQTSSGASDLYKQMIVTVSNISASKDMDEGAKRQAIENQVVMLNNGLAMMGQISNLNLSDFLTFADVGGVPSGTQPTAEGAPTPAQDQPNALQWAPVSAPAPAPAPVAPVAGSYFEGYG